LDIAKASMQQNTRRYAKRQMTWFRKDDRIQWLSMENFDTMDEVVEEIIEKLKED